MTAQRTSITILKKLKDFLISNLTLYHFKIKFKVLSQSSVREPQPHNSLSVGLCRINRSKIVDSDVVVHKIILF